jgi:hypothetical protein
MTRQLAHLEDGPIGKCTKFLKSTVFSLIHDQLHNQWTALFFTPKSCILLGYINLRQLVIEYDNQLSQMTGLTRRWFVIMNNLNITSYQKHIWSYVQLQGQSTVSINPKLTPKMMSCDVMSQWRYVICHFWCTFSDDARVIDSLDCQLQAKLSVMFESFMVSNILSFPSSKYTWTMLLYFSFKRIVEL